MAKDFTTPLARVRRDGAAGEGPGHFVGQRASAVALAILSPLTLILVLTAAASGPGGVTDMLSTGWGAIVTILFFTAALYHGRLGVQDVIDDYIARQGTRIVLLLANTFFTAALWVAVTVSILKLSFGG